MASNRTYDIDLAGSIEGFVESLVRDRPKPDEEASKSPGSSYSLQDALRIIQVQQATINKLNKELANRTQSISRSTYEKVLNELETEKYEHARTKLELMELKDQLQAKINDCEYFKNELEKERCAFGNTFNMLKSKAIDEGHNSVELISKITDFFSNLQESELRYNDAIEGMKQKDKKYSELVTKLKKKEQTFENEIQEMNLKLEQDKYINQLLNEPRSGSTNKSKSRRE